MPRHFLRWMFVFAVLTVYFSIGRVNVLQAQDTEVSTDPISSTLDDISKINKSDLNSALAIVGGPQSGGGSGFDMYKMISYFIFGGIGFVAFVYGKKNSLFRAMIIGVALNIYPYFISSTLIIYIVGIALTALLFIWRD